jgi:hypothetical protein
MLAGGQGSSDTEGDDVDGPQLEVTAFAPRPFPSQNIAGVTACFGTQCVHLVFA